MFELKQWLGVEIPRGLCQCGCGAPTKLSGQTRTDRGDVEGQPIKFMLGHSPKTSFNRREQLFWNKMRLTASGCWEWTGHLDAKGYGRITLAFLGERRAHRVSYRLVNGEIPAKFDLDHLCRNHRCINPLHLEAVTRSENVRRGIRARRSL